MSAEFIKGGQLAIGVLQRLSAMQPVKGAIYNNIILSSSEPDIFDRYDRSVSSLARYATFYWPGGDPETQANFETISLRELPRPSEVGAEVARIRKTILGAYIGQAAIERVPPDMRELWRITEENVPDPISRLVEACKRVELPPAVCLTSDITSGEAGGAERIMHLWYPSTIHPRPVLDELHGAVQEAMLQEIRWGLYY